MTSTQLRNDLFRTPIDPKTRGMWERDVTTFLNNVRSYLVDLGADPAILGEIATIGALNDARLSALERANATQQALSASNSAEIAGLGVGDIDRALAVQAAFIEGLRADSLQKTTRVVTFDASGIWTRPSGLRSIDVFCVGGGGGGGGGREGGGFSSTGGGGGGGGGYSYCSLRADALPVSVSVTPGAGGIAGTPGAPGTDGGDGGTSNFGNIIVAVGGKGGKAGTAGASAAGGAGAVINGSLFVGGPGGSGRSGLAVGDSAVNDFQAAPGGGGGGGQTGAGAATAGGDGGAGSWRTVALTGGGGTGGPAGASGTNGAAVADSDQYLGPGYGGGGGGGASNVAGDGGDGGNGVVGAGGGGGGGADSGIAGTGGAGGNGRIIIVEHY